MIRICSQLALALLGVLLNCSAPAATLEDLFAQAKVSSVKISPNGDYLGVRLLEDGKHSVLFLDRKTLQPTGSFQFRGKSEIGTFFWVNNERIVAHIYELGKGSERPKNYGELGAANYDGGKAEIIFGYRAGERQAETILKTKQVEYAWGRLIDPIPENKKEILISAERMSSSHNRRPVAVMLNVYDGIRGERMHVPNFASASFITDSEGRPRLASGIDENRQYHVETLPPGAEEWITLEGIDFGTNFYPVAISGDGVYAYALANLNGDKLGLHKLALDGSEYKQVYVNDEVDITSVEVTPDGRGIFAMRIDKDFPSYLVMSQTHSEAVVFKQLLQVFPGQAVSVTSDTEDGRFWVIKASSDVDPGSYYLLDREQNSMQLLFRSKPNIKPDELAKVEPISFESFDGLKITGYFTPAQTNDDKTAPMVVLVHGGPRSRDDWSFDPYVQSLATNGYSVLQINYRGSDGFGNSFMNAGNRHWGDHIQQDIIEGTRWAIAEGRAETGNVCIMGGSFGAYSALQSSILVPDLYACAVANAGIYDLEIMYERGDIEDFYWGDGYLEEVIGRNPEELRKFSPAYNVASIQAPLFIAHGKQDDRAPYEHANRLRKALDEHDKDYEWFAESREAHGFYDTSTQVEYMEKVLKFLDKHLN